MGWLVLAGLLAALGWWAMAPGVKREEARIWAFLAALAMSAFGIVAQLVTTGTVGIPCCG